MLVPVILCGGSGTRLWPLSRLNSPKQFVDLGNGRTLFKDTVKRAKLVGCGGEAPIIVTSEACQFLAKASLMACAQEATIIVEPATRNTASAITAAALVAKQIYDEPTLLIMPSDHDVLDLGKLKEAVDFGTKLAKNGYLVTFGIAPSRAETGYGYIKLGSKISDYGFRVDRFVEKPKKYIAEQLVASHKYLWNSGIFMFQAEDYLRELNTFVPEINTAVQKAIANGSRGDGIIYLDESSYKLSPAISIDYALMEQTTQTAVVPLMTSWNDLGSWEAFYESEEKDDNGNVLKGDVVALETKNSYINSQNRLVAVIGLNDIAIVETSDAMLVAPLARSQDVRNIVEVLQSTKRSEIYIHPQVHRPWGSYEVLKKGDRFQVKRIEVRAGEQLSLQKHFHRSEHWIIVQGSAEVVLGDKLIFLTENQSTYIPAGEIHQLRNPGKLPLVVIEIQCGNYLEEDDIVRLEDKYNRV